MGSEMIVYDTVIVVGAGSDTDFGARKTKSRRECV